MQEVEEQAEDTGVNERPAAPQQVGGTHAVGPLLAAVQPQADDQPDGRQRQQPGDLAADLLIEQAQHSGAAAEPSAGTAARASAGRAGGGAIEAVGIEDQVPPGVAGGVAD